MAHPSPQNRIFDSLPEAIRTAILTYAKESGLSPQAVIEFAMRRFLELDSAPSEEAQMRIDEPGLLASLPPWLQSQARQYATNVEMPPEFVLELALVYLMDPDAVTFDDCRVQVQWETVEQLKQYRQAQAASAA
jgi:hypothetical protein